MFTSLGSARRRGAAAILAATVVAAGALTVVSSNVNAELTAGSGEQLVPLKTAHQNASNYRFSRDCKNVTGDDDLWHFVIPGNVLFTIKDIEASFTAGAEITSIKIGSNSGRPNQVDVTTKNIAGATTLLDATALVTPGSPTGAVLNLSHVCPAADPDLPPPPVPSISVSKTVAVTHDETYDWSADKRYLGATAVGSTAVDATYAVDVVRSGPRPVPGSYIVSGDITVTNTGDVPVSINSVTDALSTDGAACSVEASVPATLDVAAAPAVYAYSCTVADLPSAAGTNTATVGWSFDGNALADASSPAVAVDYATSAVVNTFNATATLSDDRFPGITPATYADSGSSDPYTLRVTAGSANCTTGYSNTATVTPDDGGPTSSDTVTIKVCKSIGGKTIGYWSNKNGAPIAARNYADVYKRYANVLAGWGPTLTDKQINAKLLGANCSGDCVEMFRAQFLATALNAATITGYGAQQLLVPTWISPNGYMSINDLLTFGNDTYLLPITQRIALKSVYDTFNQDSGQGIQCPTVIDD